MVLADTVYKYEGQPVTMPVTWTKQWGRGRVFYPALGHKAEEFIQNNTFSSRKRQLLNDLSTSLNLPKLYSFGYKLKRNNPSVIS